MTLLRDSVAHGTQELEKPGFRIPIPLNHGVGTVFSLHGPAGPYSLTGKWSWPLISWSSVERNGPDGLVLTALAVPGATYIPGL